MKYIKQLIKEEYRKLIKEGFSLNVANTPLKKAIKYSQNEFKKANNDLYDVIPDFDKNYKYLQKQISFALDIPRIDMPVIEPDNMDSFYKDLLAGHIDIFKPYALDGEYYPKNLKPGEDADKWLSLGQMDFDNTDDIVKGKWTKMPAKKLKPTQSEIWLENIIPNIIKFGVPTDSSPIVKAVLIVSKEGYIIDGHHRYAQAIIANPSLKMNVLYIPLDIDTLLKMGRSYGNAKGNKQKQ